MGLSDESSIITLITYLDKDTQAIIEERNLGTLENWADFKKHLLEVAKVPASKTRPRETCRLLNFVEKFSTVTMCEGSCAF